MNDQIETLDPFMPTYVMEKMTNPNRRLEMRQFRSDDVMFVDRMIQLTKGKTRIVTTEDWDRFREVVTFFSDRWPDEFASFKESVDLIRKTRGRGGYSKSREIKYTASLPPRLENIIKKLYPEQEFNRVFVSQLTKRLPIFKIGGEGN